METRMENGKLLVLLATRLLMTSRAAGTKPGRGRHVSRKTGHQCRQVPLKYESRSIPMTDLCICCSLFHRENGDCSNLPQVILSINHRDGAHLHTLS